MRAETAVEEPALACDYRGKALICEWQVGAFCYAAGAWIRDIWYRSVLRHDAFGYGNESCLGLHTEDIIVYILYDAMIAHGMQRFEISGYVRIDTVLIEESGDICAESLLK